MTQVANAGGQGRWSEMVAKGKARALPRPTKESLYPYGRRAFSSAYDWQESLYEQEEFEFFGMSWDVSLAKILLREQPRRIEGFAVTDVLAFLPEPPGAATSKRTIDTTMNIDWPRALRSPLIDLSLPVIVVTVGRNRLPIDGWHRIARAYAQQLGELPCVTLTDAETRQIRIGK